MRRKGFLHAQSASGLCVLYAETENRSAFCVGRASSMRKVQAYCAFCTQKRRIGVHFVQEGLPSCTKCRRIVRFVRKIGESQEGLPSCAKCKLIVRFVLERENRTAAWVGRAGQPRTWLRPLCVETQVTNFRTLQVELAGLCCFRATKTLP